MTSLVTSSSLFYYVVIIIYPDYTYSITISVDTIEVKAGRDNSE